MVLILGLLLLQDGFTPLHKAVIGKKEAVISHLLRKGANPHVRDRVTGTIFCGLFSIVP
jgi:ankyrin repeat protein